MFRKCALTTLCAASILIGVVLTRADSRQLRASAEGQLAGGLKVDEKGLRKIVDLIKERFLQKSEQFLITLDVTLGGNSYYSTPNIDQVVAEENVGNQRIQSIRIRAQLAPTLQTHRPLSPEQQTALEEKLLELSGSENPKINITLDKTGAAYTISGADRGWVLGTQVDLSERLRTYITVQFPWFIAASALVGFFGGASVFAGRARRFRRKHYDIERAKNPNYPAMSLPR